MRSKRSGLIFAAVFALMAGIALFRVFGQTRKDPPGQDDEDQGEAVKMHSRVSVRNGKAIIKLDAASQSLAGISTAPLQETRERQQTAAPAVVISVQDLVNLYANYSAGRARLSKAQNNLDVSRREYERLKSLYANQQNISAKALEAAKGAFENDQTDVAAARQNLQSLTATLRQTWGAQIAQWVVEDSPALGRILNREELLVQVTLPPGELPSAPSTISLQLPTPRRAVARLISTFPRVDPRIQGSSFLYGTPGTSALAPGLNLVAYLSFGPRVAGVVVPSSAIVWWNGEAWVYVLTSANEFTRQEIPTGHPVAGGYFISKGFSRGEKIAVAGAQSLLSEEFGSPSQGEDTGDTD